MSEEDIKALFAEQNRVIEERFRLIVTEMGGAARELNAIYAQSEERARAADARDVQQEKESDNRQHAAAERALRQVVAWERIAVALERMANCMSSSGVTP